MNSLILISPSKTWGFQPILSGNFQKKVGFLQPAAERADLRKSVFRLTNFSLNFK